MHEHSFLFENPSSSGEDREFAGSFSSHYNQEVEPPLRYEYMLNSIRLLVN